MVCNLLCFRNKVDANAVHPGFAMAFHNSRYADASGSHFYDVGRDQTQYVTINNITISGSSSKQAFHHLRHNFLQLILPTSSPVTPSRRVLMQECSSKPLCVNMAADIIVEIVQSLIDHGESPYHYRNLKLELGLLHKTLTLTGLAMKIYENTPLCQSLANIVNPEAEQCCMVLRELLDKINTYRRGLYSTSISDLWRKIFWNGCDVDEQAPLLGALSTRRKSLGNFLLALNS